MRYDWNADRLETFEGRDDGPCGFVVHDFALGPKYLWVATDLGLSRWGRRARRWNHFVPDMAARPPMRATTCEALYTNLLKTLPRAATGDTSEIGSYYSQLFEPLKRFRPRFLGSYVKTLRPAEWGCDELQFLGPNAWRDVLLALLETPSFPEQREILGLLEPFVGDTKVGGMLMRRLETTPNPWREAELLPSILGDKSLPALFEALDRFKGETHVVRSIVVGLMRATHIAISPDGNLTNIPRGAEPEICDIVECPRNHESVARVADHRPTWWEAHKRE